MVNNRKDIDQLVSNINLNSDMVFFIYSSDRNRIHTLVREEENKHRIISFDVKYKKDVFLEMETTYNKEEFKKNYGVILSIMKNIGKIKVYDELINSPHHYRNDEENNSISTKFGWDFQIIKEKKKGTK